MKTKLITEHTFSACHRLPAVPDWHKCKTWHGHNYRVRLEVTGEVNPVMGWVCDFASIKTGWSVVFAEVDHRILNDVTGLENPTAENIAAWIAQKLRPIVRRDCKAELCAVEVWETDQVAARVEVG